MRSFIAFVLFISGSPAYPSVCEDSFLKIKFNEIVTEIAVEIADTHSKRKKGLMFRDSLDLYSGMLFIYDNPRKVSFWMKNTIFPLDMAFADKRGKVVRVVANTEPLSLDLIDGGENIQYVLEINAGLSEDMNLFEGSLLLHPLINKNDASPC